jgi:hypothetical protein
LLGLVELREKLDEAELGSNVCLWVEERHGDFLYGVVVV